MQSSATMVGTVIAPLLATRLGGAFGLQWVFAFVGVTALAGAIAFSVLVRGWETQPIEDTGLVESAPEEPVGQMANG